jgi:hypothetical protein
MTAWYHPNTICDVLWWPPREDGGLDVGGVGFDAAFALGDCSNTSDLYVDMVTPLRMPAGFSATEQVAFVVAVAIVVVIMVAVDPVAGSTSMWPILLSPALPPPLSISASSLLPTTSNVLSGMRVCVS